MFHDQASCTALQSNVCRDHSSTWNTTSTNTSNWDLHHCGHEGLDGGDGSEEDGVLVTLAALRQQQPEQQSTTMMRTADINQIDAQ